VVRPYFREEEKTMSEKKSISSPIEHIRTAFGLEPTPAPEQAQREEAVLRTVKWQLEILGVTDFDDEGQVTLKELITLFGCEWSKQRGFPSLQKEFLPGSAPLDAETEGNLLLAIGLRNSDMGDDEVD
jgi:hypothetical protein